jgi:hypothetical protein
MEQSPENPETRGLRVTPLAMEGAGGTTIKQGALKEERLGTQGAIPGESLRLGV